MRFKQANIKLTSLLIRALCSSVLALNSSLFEGMKHLQLQYCGKPVPTLVPFLPSANELTHDNFALR